MAPFQTSQGAISEDMVAKVGSAAGRVARIQQEYAMNVEAETAAEAREVAGQRRRGPRQNARSMNRGSPSRTTMRF